MSKSQNARLKDFSRAGAIFPMIFYNYTAAEALQKIVIKIPSRTVIKT